MKTKKNKCPLNTIEHLFLAYRDGTISPNEVVEHFLGNIERLNGYYDAYQSIWAKEAVEAAHVAEKSLKAGYDRGPLHGIPFALKDIFFVEGKHTSCGSSVVKNNKLKPTSEVVGRLVDGGAIILGKTKTVECLSLIHI